MKYLLIACSLLIYVSFASGLHHNPVRPQCVECMLSLLRSGKLYAASRLLQQFDPYNYLDACQSDGITILHYFASHYYSEGWIKLLLEKGANIHARTADGNTPFTLAVMNKNYHAACMLAAAGAEIDVELPNRTTPLHLFCASNRFVNELESLLARNEMTASLVVFVKKLLMPLRRPLSLKEQIANQHYQDFLRPAIFCTLIPELQVEVLYAFWQQKKYFGMHYLSLIKDSTVALELLKNRILRNSYTDAPVNKKDENGNTVLHILSQSTQHRFVAFLVNNGADRLITNNEDKTPRDLIPDHEITNNPFRRPVAECLSQPQVVLNKINELIILNHQTGNKK